MRTSRGRVAGLVAVLAALAPGCALVVDGLSTDFSAADDGAAPAADAARQDAATSAADADSSAPLLPAPTPFPAFPLSCNAAATNAWHLDCSFGDAGSVVVGNPSGPAAPVLSEGAGSAAVYVAVAREAGTFIEGIDDAGERTVFAIADHAGVPVDLTTTTVRTVVTVITMLSNSLVDGTSNTMTPVISSKALQGMPVDSTNDIGVAVVATLDASLVAVRPLVATPLISGTGGTVALSYFVDYLDGGVAFVPGRGSAQGTSSGVVAYPIQPLGASGPDANAIDIGPIVTGIDFLSTSAFVVGYGSDGGSTSYAIPDDAAAHAAATVLPLPYVVDDSVTVVEGMHTYPLVAGRVDGGARVDSLAPFTATSSLPNFPFDDPGVGPLRLRAVHVVDGGGDELLVAGANSSTGDLYLVLYSINALPSFALTADPAFGDGGFLTVPLQFPAQLGAAISGQDGYYVSLTLTDADAGATAAVVIRIAPPESP